MYYVSETDMLKAMHMALYDEVIRIDKVIKDKNFKNLYNFVEVLSDVCFFFIKNIFFAIFYI